MTIDEFAVGLVTFGELFQELGTEKTAEEIARIQEAILNTLEDRCILITPRTEIKERAMLNAKEFQYGLRFHEEHGTWPDIDKIITGAIENVKKSLSGDPSDSSPSSQSPSTTQNT